MPMLGSISRSPSPIDYGNEYKAKRGELYQSYGRVGSPPTLTAPTGLAPYTYPQPRPPLERQWSVKSDKEATAAGAAGTLQSGWADKSDQSRRRNGNLSD